MRRLLLLTLLIFAVAVAPAAATPPGATPPSCTKTIANAGDDLSTFLGTLTSGDVGCLKGGTYLDGCAITWSGSGTSGSPTILQSKPGETAVINTQITLSGNYTQVQNVTRTGAGAGCTVTYDGFKLDGDHNSILDNEIYDIPRHGVLTGTSSSNVDISRNTIHGTGCDYGTTTVHGIYFQKSGTIARNVIYGIPCGYGIHLYSGPADALVVNNTVSTGTSGTRGGILINCATNCDVVNNIFTDSHVYGIAYRACTSGCLVDNNLTYNNTSGPGGDTLWGSATNTTNADPLFDGTYHLGVASPAIGTGTDSLASWPDKDGATAAVGTSDKGAYESPYPPNKVANPQADTDLAHISTNGTGTRSRDTTVYRSSPASVAVTALAQNDGATWYGTGSPGADDILNDPSDTVRGSAYVRGTAGNVVRIAISERNASGGFLRESFVNSTIATTGVWQRIDTGAVTVGADCYGHRVKVVGNAAMTFSVDDVQSTEGSTLYPYAP